MNDEVGLPSYLLLTDFAKNPNVRQKKQQLKATLKNHPFHSPRFQLNNQ
jgi:hypothetical protein